MIHRYEDGENDVCIRTTAGIFLSMIVAHSTDAEMMKNGVEDCILLDCMTAHYIQVDLFKMSAIITSMMVMVLVRNNLCRCQTTVSEGPAESRSRPETVVSVNARFLFSDLVMRVQLI